MLTGLDIKHAGEANDFAKAHKSEDLEIIRLEPVFKDAVWGGKALHEFGYEKAGDKTGECWGISAHQDGDCKIVGGPFEGHTLSWLYKNHRELFGNIKKEVFPLLVKLIGAADDLSFQVHPNDKYAAEHENGSLGKTECWYILDCDEDATIVVGHNAKAKDDLAVMIRERRWDDWIRVKSIKPGDFFQIEPGCLHAIKGGTLLIETQQSSTVTYRVYDYDRLSNGQLRPLHIEDSIACISAPHEDFPVKPTTEVIGSTEITTFVECKHYIMKKYIIKDTFTFENDKPFLNVSIIKGSGTINGQKINKGDHLILTSQAKESSMSGNMSVLVSFV